MMETSSNSLHTVKKAIRFSSSHNPIAKFLHSFFHHAIGKAPQSLEHHRFAIQVNPWSITPLPRGLAALQHHSLLLAAQQQSLQHALLKHILACTDLNSRVRGIAAYEEYEALLREVKGCRFTISAEVLESISNEMSLRITKIFEDHPRLQQHYGELQRRILQASWHTMRELMADENRMSPHFLQVKRIQHCWLLYKRL